MTDHVRAGAASGACGGLACSEPGQRAKAHRVLGAAATIAIASAGVGFHRENFSVDHSWTALAQSSVT